MDLNKEKQLSIDRFNAKCKIGDRVTYTNDKGEEISAFLRWPAEILESGIQVVWVTGNYNAVLLINVKP